ncbi:DUF3892 domain-containing protein [Piscibacillus sp. B03]|uniref:DUF3892 domain-containing protein n=1 Tax=Piscibacillus TaxID=420644 RepID=UPI00158E1C37|nr:DUF3892 domain-containing protein [Piscibacillus halophilus]
MNQETFVAVRKDKDGDITHFKTSSGRELDYEQALAEIQNGTIEGVNIGEARNGRPVIRGNADGDPTNNLDNLETF